MLTNQEPDRNIEDLTDTRYMTQFAILNQAQKTRTRWMRMIGKKITVSSSASVCMPHS